MMRKRWSYLILAAICTIIIFDMILVILYGLKILNFDDSNIVIAVVADGFLKVVGLGYLMTKNIFQNVGYRYA